jgi:hypothetical protein
MRTIRYGIKVCGPKAGPRNWSRYETDLALSRVRRSSCCKNYLIPFTNREDFESAWPHLVKVKSKGAPIILVRGPKTDFFEVKPAGVHIHSPPAQTDKRTNPEAPLAGTTNVTERWMWTTYIELVVDGQIVDLNRIPLPPDTPIIDERFKDRKNK